MDSSGKAGSLPTSSQATATAIPLVRMREEACMVPYAMAGAPGLVPNSGFPQWNPMAVYGVSRRGPSILAMPGFPGFPRHSVPWAYNSAQFGGFMPYGVHSPVVGPSSMNENRTDQLMEVLSNGQLASCEPSARNKSDSGGGKDNEGKKYKCTYKHCSRSFDQKNNLARHIRSVHEKTRRYQCPHKNCDKKFAEKNTLTIHICAVHAAETSEEELNALGVKTKFSCPAEGCERFFSIRSRLQKHVQTHHKGQDIVIPSTSDEEEEGE